MEVHVGCSGWFYWHWRGIFYPDTKRTDSWFKHYTATFKTVELNAPFYKWPKNTTVKSWRRHAPDDFRYSVKVNRLITHEKRMVRTRMLVEEFYKIEELLGPKLGCFLFQFPPSYRYSHSRLTSIATQLNPKYRNAVEFRHKSWWRESVYRRFTERGLIFCSISAPKLPDDLVKSSDALYIRLHGRTRWYRHDYTTEELADWVRKVSESGAHEAWIYFDNDRDAFAIKNAQEMIRQFRTLGLDVA